jgi:hypothetical protein
MSEGAEYGAAIDRHGERCAEYEFLRAARAHLMEHPDSSMSQGEHLQRIQAAQRLMDTAWKAAFDADRAKEAAWFRLVEADNAK